MHMELNLLHVPGPVDLERGRAVISSTDPMDFVWTFDGSPGGAALIGHEDLRSPWESSSLEALAEAAESYSAEERADSMFEVAWNGAAEQLRDEFRGAVRWSAGRWAESIALVASHRDKWFESDIATWIPVVSGGELLIAPQNSAGFDSDSLYGDLFVEAQGRYSTVAAAMGIRALAVEEIRLDVA
jgi:hypothetical protein